MCTWPRPMPADAHHCPHLPTTGRVYRVRVVEAVPSRDAPVSDYRVCARCHAALLALVGAPAPMPAVEPAPPAWELTRTAIERFAHVLRDAARVSGQRPVEPTLADAERRLRELVPTATYRETDSEGRELWRSPPSASGLRWVVQGGRVLWVGQGRPPDRLFQRTPEDTA